MLATNVDSDFRNLEAQQELTLIVWLKFGYYVLLLQVLWKEIQALQVEQELDREFGHHGGGGHQNHHHGGQGGQGYPDRRVEREKRRVTERKLGRLIGGAESRIYDDSDSSRGGYTTEKGQQGACQDLESGGNSDES